jgi:signal transduction histidine kinase
MGTGLGLSISYDIIVTKHKGELLVDSGDNKGTKFTIKLPIINKEQENELQKQENDRKENSTVRGR